MDEVYGKERFFKVKLDIILQYIIIVQISFNLVSLYENKKYRTLPSKKADQDIFRLYVGGVDSGHHYPRYPRNHSVRESRMILRFRSGRIPGIRSCEHIQGSRYYQDQNRELSIAILLYGNHLLVRNRMVSRNYRGECCLHYQ